MAASPSCRVGFRLANVVDHAFGPAVDALYIDGAWLEYVRKA